MWNISSSTEDRMQLLIALMGLVMLPAVTAGKQQGTIVESSSVKSLEENCQLHQENLQKLEAKHLDIDSGCMLLGFTVLVMFMLTILNYKDDDIRRYAWMLISDTLSTFIGVITFAAVGGCIDIFCQKVQLSFETICGINYIVFLLSWSLMQFCLAITTGAIHEGPDHNLNEVLWVYEDAMRCDYGQPVPDDSLVHNKRYDRSTISVAQYGGSFVVPVKRQNVNFHNRARNVIASQKLLTDFCANSAMRAGTSMQQLPVFATSPFMSLLAAVLNHMVVSVIFFSFRSLRQRLPDHDRDGLRLGMLKGASTDAEKDVLQLASSFLLVQFGRFATVGKLPNASGKIEGRTPWGSVYSLYTIGIGCVVLSVIAILRGAHDDSRFDLLPGTLLVGSAWSCMHASRTVFMQAPAIMAIGIEAERVHGLIILALCLSLISFCMIFPLDAIADCVGNSGFSKLEDAYVGAIAVLIGFSWEAAFASGLGAIGSTTSRPQLTFCALALAVLLIVVPPWKTHVLSRKLALEAFHKHRLEAWYKADDGKATQPEVCPGIPKYEKIKL